MGIRDRWMLDRIRAKSPILLAMGLADIPRSQREQQKAGLARAARVGRDAGSIVEHSDIGPSIRRIDVKAPDNTVLREADIITERVCDPEVANYEFHRARRADALTTMYKLGSIEKRERRAGEQLRDDWACAVERIPSGLRIKIASSPFMRIALHEEQFKFRDRVRAAYAAVGDEDWNVVVWIVHYGTLTAFSVLARKRPETVSASLRSGLKTLADYYDEVL
jgi:hypothetical protein